MICRCGCGRPTNIAKKTNRKLGHVRGQPLPYLTGHAGAAASRRSLLERFEEKVDRTSKEEHWFWTGSKMVNGYGKIGVGGKYGGWKLAHRIAWELYRGPIPEGLTIDHLCRIRHCVNPQHLEPVTNAENLRRGNGPPRGKRPWMRKSHCKYGHAFTAENTRVEKDGSRRCRACQRRRDRERGPRRGKGSE